MMKRLFAFAWLLTTLVACSGRGVGLTASQTQGLTALPAVTVPPTPTSVTAQSPTKRVAPQPTATLSQDAWMSMPDIPASISLRVHQIYLHGLALGNNPKAFSIIGDCDATPTWFLGDFDLGPKHYTLGEYAYLQAVIDQFHGSFGRSSVAVRRGFTAASVLTQIWSDPKLCLSTETPLACELRLNRPSFAFILLGTNDFNHREVFEPNLRTILDALIANGVVPILATKADDLEGDHSLNATIVRMAYEYDLPLWNFWRVVQPLPNRGLQPDRSHLTWAANFFDDPVRMQAAWPWRNLTALQTLNAVWRGVTVQP